MIEAPLLFVYGTLLRGERNHDYLLRARFLGEVSTVPGFLLVDCGLYPGMVKGGRAAVHGEIFAVDPETLARVDELEGRADLFWRARIELVDRRQAWAYLYPAQRASGLPGIAGGDWRSR